MTIPYLLQYALLFYCALLSIDPQGRRIELPRNCAQYEKFKRVEKFKQVGSRIQPGEWLKSTAGSIAVSGPFSTSASCTHRIARSSIFGAGRLAGSSSGAPVTSGGGQGGQSLTAGNRPWQIGHARAP